MPSSGDPRYEYAPDLVDPHFDEDEELYIRFPPGPAQRLRDVDIRFPDQSADRSKYSDPQDVRNPDWHTWGVAAIVVADVPEPYRTDDGPTYEMKVVHWPLRDHVAHTELRVHKDGVFKRKLKVPTPGTCRKHSRGLA